MTRTQGVVRAIVYTTLLLGLVAIYAAGQTWVGP